jgi:hypothetical protein
VAIAICFNELSFQAPAASVSDARLWISGLTDTLLAFASQGVTVPLRGIAGLHNLPLAENYPIAKWLNDPVVSREHRTYLRNRLAQAPTLRNEDALQSEDDTEVWEFRFNGQSAIGLAAAFRLDGIAVSFLSDTVWDTSRLAIEVSRLGMDEEVVEARETIRHAATPRHIDDHAGWISDFRRTVRDFHDMWDRRTILFPSLDFCDSVKKQLEGISPGNPHWHAILKRLWALEDYFSVWTAGPFLADEIACKTSPESQVTLDQFSSCRTFLCPDDVPRVFSWHCRFTPNAGRLYFFPVEATRRGIVGYIGPHLPTVNYPT